MEIKRENRTLASVRGMLSEGPVFVAYVWWKDRPKDGETEGGERTHAFIYSHSSEEVMTEVFGVLVRGGFETFGTNAKIHVDLEKGVFKEYDGPPRVYVKKEVRVICFPSTESEADMAKLLGL